MLMRFPFAIYAGTTELYDHKLVFCGADGNSLVTIEPSIGDTVPAVVWELAVADEPLLDQVESCPALFGKEVLEVVLFTSAEEMYAQNISGELIEAIVYIMYDGNPANMPSTDYLNTILDGYDELGFDPTAIEAALEAAMA